MESIIDQLPLLTQTPRVAVEKNSNIDKNIGIKSKDVFIVHGHDDGLKMRWRGLLPIWGMIQSSYMKGRIRVNHNREN